VLDGGRRVLIAVRKTGVTVVTCVPAAVSGQGCKATGNNKQLEAFEQIFRLKLVDCAPLQTSTRLPLTTSAVRHVTGEPDSTSKIAESGKIKTACAKLFTQNWHCISTTFSPVIGMTGVTGVFVSVTAIELVPVGAGASMCSVGMILVDGGTGVCTDKLQAEVQRTSINTPIKNGRDHFFISGLLHQLPSCVSR
jgi:hypothetical protein